MYLVGEHDYRIKTLSSWIRLIQFHFNSIQSLQEIIYILSVQDYTTILGLSDTYSVSQILKFDQVICYMCCWQWEKIGQHIAKWSLKYSYSFDMLLFVFSLLLHGSILTVTCLRNKIDLAWPKCNSIITFLWIPTSKLCKGIMMLMCCSTKAWV